MVEFPPHPANLDPYIETLGHSLALEFLSKFGGSRLNFPNDPSGRNMAVALIGVEKFCALGEALNAEHVEIPVARTWRIHALAAMGYSQNEIARRMNTSYRNVRDCLEADPRTGRGRKPAKLLAKSGRDHAASDGIAAPTQLGLFD